MEKLTDNIFHIWNQEVKFVPAFRKLNDILTDSKPAKNENELPERKKRDAKAKSILGVTLSDDHLDHVHGLSSVADMRKALANISHRLTLLSKLGARRKFYTAKISNEKGALTHINRMRQLSSDLTSIETVVTDKNVAKKVLCSLRKRLEPLTVTFDTVSSDGKLSLDFAKS